MNSEDLHERNQSLHRVIMGNGQGKKSDLSDDILNSEMESNGGRANRDDAVSCGEDLTDSEGDLLNLDEGDDEQDQIIKEKSPVSRVNSDQAAEVARVKNIGVNDNKCNAIDNSESFSYLEAALAEITRTKPSQGGDSGRRILQNDDENQEVLVNGLSLNSDISESDVFINETIKSKEDALCDDEIEAVLPNMSSSVEDDLEVEINEHISLSTNEDDESLEGEKHNLHHVQGPCFCLTCKSKSDHQLEILHLKSDWKDVQKFINCIYSSIIKSIVPVAPESVKGTLPDDEIKQRITRLVTDDPYQLYLGLVKILEDYADYIHGEMWAVLMISDEQLSPNIFLEQMFEKYDRLTTAARRVIPALEPFQVQYLDHLNMTWDILNKYHFQHYVYSDKLMQENLPLFIAQLKNLLSSKREAYQEMIRFYLAFDDEMNIVKAMWQEFNARLQKFKQDQAVMKERQTMLHTKWEMFKAQRKQSIQNGNEFDGQDYENKHPGGGDAPANLVNGGARGDTADKTDEEDEFSEVPDSPQQSCECHVCTAPPVSTEVDLMDGYGCQMCLEMTRMLNGVEPRLPAFHDHQHHFNHHPNNFQYYPFSNGSAGGGGDTNGVYPHLYNVHPSLLAQLGTRHSRLNVESETIDSPPCAAMPPLSSPSPSPSSSALPNQLKTPNVEKDPPPLNFPVVSSSPTFNKTVSIPTSTATLSSVRMSRNASTTTTSPALNCQQNNLCTCQNAPCPTESPPLQFRARASSLPGSSVSALPQQRPVIHKPPAAADVHGSQTRRQPINVPVASQPSTSCSTAPKVRNSTTQTSSGILNQPTDHNHAHACNGAVRRTNGLVPEHTCVNGITAGVDGMRVSCDASCSAEDDSSSSRDGSCSSTPSTQRDPRHCDCCYCEVFGNSSPAVAPTSRNYHEMRERLRQLLTKKRAKCRSPNKAVQSPPSTPPTPSAKPPTPSVGHRGAVPPEAARTVQSGPGRGPVAKAGPAPLQSAPHPPPASSSSLTSTKTRQGDTRCVDDLVDFIEGNQPTQPKVQESKNAAKKARRRQKKQQEEQQRLEAEAVERQRLMELQAKTPEVTITVLKNGVPHSLGLPQPSQHASVNRDRTNRGMEVKAPQAPVTTAKSIHDHIKSQVGEAGLNRQEPQMVTIKRVMEPNSVEPTVTITLKGATPDKDKVLFTLVNGQNEVVPEPPQPARKTKKQLKKEKQRLQRQILQEQAEEEESEGKLLESDKAKLALHGMGREDLKSIAIDDEFDITLEQLGKKERKRLRKEKLQEINMQRDAEKRDREEKERREREKREEERRLEEIFTQQQKELERLQQVFRCHQERVLILQQQKQLSRKQRKQDQKLQQEFIRTQQQLLEQEERWMKLKSKYPNFYNQKIQSSAEQHKKGHQQFDVQKGQKSKQKVKEEERKQQKQQHQQQHQQLKQQQKLQQQLQQQELKLQQEKRLQEQRLKEQHQKLLQQQQLKRQQHQQKLLQVQQEQQKLLQLQQQQQKLLQQQQQQKLLQQQKQQKQSQQQQKQSKEQRSKEQQQKQLQQQQQLKQQQQKQLQQQQVKQQQQKQLQQQQVKQQQQKQLQQQQLKQQQQKQLQQQQLKQQQQKQLQQQQLKQQQQKQLQQQQLKQQQQKQLQQQQLKQQQQKQLQQQQQLKQQQQKQLQQQQQLKQQQQKLLQQQQQTQQQKQQKQQQQVQSNQKQQPKQAQQQQKPAVQQTSQKSSKQPKQLQQPAQQVQQPSKKQLKQQQQHQEPPQQLTKKQLKQLQQQQQQQQQQPVQQSQKQKQQTAQKQQPAQSAPQKQKKQQQQQQSLSTKQNKQKPAEQQASGLDWVAQTALAAARPRVTLQPSNPGSAVTSLEQRFSSLSLNGAPLVPSLPRPPAEPKAPFSLESLRLPPGITITKVDASHAPPRKQPIAKPQVTKTIVSNPAPTTIIAAPLSGRSSSGYGSNQDPSSNVIVVDTGKLKQELLVKDGAAEGEKKKRKKKKKKAVNEPGNQAPQMPLPAQIPPYLLNSVSISMAGQAAPPPPVQQQPQAAIIKVNGNMVTIRNPAMHPSPLPPPTPQPRLQPQVAMNGEAGRKSKKGNNSSNSKEKVTGNYPNAKLTLQQATSQMNGFITGLAQANSKTQNQQVRQPQQVQQSQMSVQEKRRAVACMREAMAAAAAENGKKGKKKGKKKNGQGNPDDWQLVDSVFAPKDIDLDNGDIDDDERELEAFKRFCLQSVPPKRKEKVHLNIKDIVLKNKTNSVGCN